MLDIYPIVSVDIVLLSGAVQLNTCHSHTYSQAPTSTHTTRVHVLPSASMRKDTLIKLTNI